MRSTLIVLAMAAIVAAQDSTDKVELRFKFEKGEKLTLKLKQKMKATLSEAPDFLKDFLGEEPMDITIEGVADLEVKEVDDAGTATLEGSFAKLEAKGSMMANDIDFSYDKAKDGGKAEEPQEEEPGMPGMPSIEDGLKQLATAPLKIKFDKFGKMTFDGEKGTASQMGGQLFNLSALVGVLPKEKVGAGDSWKNEEQLAFPGLPLKMKVKATNKFDKVEKKDGVECAVIKSDFTVGSDEEESSEGPIQLKGKFTGKGNGTMVFDHAGGKPVSNSIKLETKFDFTMPNPQGGDDMTIKGDFNMEQSSELKKK